MSSITCGGYYDSGPDDTDEETEPCDRKSNGIKIRPYIRGVRKKFKSFVSAFEICPLYTRDIPLDMAVRMISAKRLRKKREAQLPKPLEQECQGIIDALNPVCWGNRL